MSLNRSPMPPRKKRMRQVSLKRAKLQRAVSKPRQAFLAEHPTCWACGEENSEHVHEMASGPDRGKALVDRAAWFAVGRKCHRAIHESSKWPLAKQLALKKKFDPEHYNRQRVNELRGRARDAVTAKQVRDAMKALGGSN